MKIISKYRDYYDHLVGYYGYDETRIYDRRNKPQDIPYNLPGKFPNTKNVWLIAICGTLYPVVLVNNKVYNHPDQMSEHIWKEGFQFLKDWTPLNKFRTTNINIEKRQPVLLVNTGVCWYDKHATDFIPTLSQFGIPSVLSANECYENIYNFLGWLKDNPEPPNNQTDKDKIFAHGFDNQSFKNGTPPKRKQKA